MRARAVTGAPPEPGVNVDRVNIAAGLREAELAGYGDDRAQMVAMYALQRWARGEEAGAEATWAGEYPRDFTSFRRIIAAAVATPDPLLEPCEACNAEAGELCRWPCTAHAEALELAGTEPCS